MGNFLAGRERTPLIALFGPGRNASRNPTRPERLAGARHA